MPLSNLIDEFQPIIAPGFETDFLKASVAYMQNPKDKLGFNSFAYSMRELIRNIFERLAPDANIKRCSLYKPTYNAQGKETITRQQRVRYAIQGGIGDSDLQILLQQQYTDMADAMKDLIDQIDTLSKYTHVTPKTFGLSPAEARVLADEVADACIRVIRMLLAVRTKFQEQIQEEVLNRIDTDFLWDIDWLATHTYTDDYMIRDCSVEIDDSTIQITIKADVTVKQQYGSDGDIRRDDGYECYKTIPVDFCFESETATSAARDFKMTRMEYDDSML